MYGYVKDSNTQVDVFGLAKNCEVNLQRVYPDWVSKGVHADAGRGEVQYYIDEAGDIAVKIFHQGKRGLSDKEMKDMLKPAKIVLEFL